MKGLLVKDFKLMKMQKNFFIIIIAIALAMSFILNDTEFMIAFLTFVISMFTLSTISYDEFDNGNAFLFTLPISRKSYTIEKYCLAVLLGGGTLIFATLLSVIVGIVRETAAVTDIVMSAFMLIPAILIIQAVMLPFQLKFGGEKGRIALIVTVGILFVAGTVIVKIIKILGIDIITVINNLPTVSMGMMAVIGIVISIAILFLSMKISISIMNKKEF